MAIVRNIVRPVVNPITDCLGIWAAYWAGRFVSALSATVNSDVQVTLNWTNNGTADYTGHKTYISIDGISYTLNKTVATIETSMVITGLTGNTYYYFKVTPYKGDNIGTLTSAILKRTLYTSGTVWPNANVILNPAAGYGYSATEIDNMLIDMAASVALIGKTITLQGSSAAPTVASIAALNTLRDRGNTVITNETIGAELITVANDRTFDSDTGFWTKGTGWSIGGGYAARTNTGTVTSFNKAPLASITNGNRYRVTVNVFSIASGSVKFRNSGTASSPSLSIAGVIIFDYVADDSNIVIEGSAAFAGLVDSVSVKRIT